MAHAMNLASLVKNIWSSLIMALNSAVNHGARRQRWRVFRQVSATCIHRIEERASTPARGSLRFGRTSTEQEGDLLDALVAVDPSPITGEIDPCSVTFALRELGGMWPDLVREDMASRKKTEAT